MILDDVVPFSVHSGCCWRVQSGISRGCRSKAWKIEQTTPLLSFYFLGPLRFPFLHWYVPWYRIDDCAFFCRSKTQGITSTFHQNTLHPSSPVKWYTVQMKRLAWQHGCVSVKARHQAAFSTFNCHCLSHSDFACRFGPSIALERLQWHSEKSPKSERFWKLKDWFRL